MGRHRKTFPCGHKGFGQICHFCAQQEHLRDQAARSRQAERDRQQQERRDWQATFDDDLVDLRDLPRPVVEKARRVLQGIAEGRDYREFHGKRLNFDRRVISIPIGRDYRLVCHEGDHGIEPQAVMSHEDYNVTCPGR